MSEDSIAVMVIRVLVGAALIGFAYFMYASQSHDGLMPVFCAIVGGAGLVAIGFGLRMLRIDGK